MLDGRGVICMSTIDWGFSWQPNQEIMYRLAEAGTPVLFVETTAARALRLSDWRRLRDRLRSALGARSGQRTHTNVTVYSPLVLPFPHSPLAHAVNTRIVFRVIDRWRRRLPSEDVVLWAFLASPMTLAVIEHVRPAAVVYQCMSDMTASRPFLRIAQAELALMSRADLVFANSLRLLEHTRRHAVRAHLFRAGVDAEAFERAARVSRMPSELADLPRPIVGYVGSIHTWMDLILLNEVATALPSWQFLMLGPILRDIGRLRERQNVRWLGQRPHHELPAYIKHFDVGIIPYVLDSYTESAYPGKLNEYLALGIPVVATPLPELVAFNEESGGVILLAGTPASFTQALIDVVEGRSAARAEDYRRVAQANSWDAQVRAMCALIAERINTRIVGSGV